MPDEPDHLDVAKESERLEELDEKIEQVRRQAAHDLDPHEGGEETFIGGDGSKREDEDQDDTIAPG
jgi:hypothetical protein